MSDAPPPPEATRAIYFDGVVNKKRAVTLVFGEDALEIVAEGLSLIHI